MSQQILTHVKSISSQNDELYKSYNKLESKIDEMTAKIANLEMNIQREGEFVTMQELQTVIDDVKNTLDFVVNSTPRNVDDIQQLKLKIDSINNRLLVLENNDEMLPVKQSVRDIPKLNLSIKRKPK